MKTFTKCIILICALAMLPVSPVQAIDDGGGRSVFARGAGERALALGGTYVAVADDPLAIIWNPAGLAAINRSGLYTSSTNLIGLGFSERMGAMALPNWKLGTFAFAFRRFGVDGIEQRDTRGTILDNDLSDTENEFLFGYGHSFNSGWKLGATVKYQQQDLAGYKDGALGLDVGIMVQPLRTIGLESPLARNLNLGLGIRNLVEPSLRLNTETVPDPTGVRAGFALFCDLGSQVRLLTTADVDKTRDMNTRLHAGTELRLLNILALRCGSNNGMLAAGAGIRYNGLTFDYTFEDNTLASVHRFGLAMAFGRTTDQKRRQAVAAREAAFQASLNAMVNRQTRVRNQKLVTQAEQALETENYQDALEKTATLRVLDPERPEITRIEAAAYLQQGKALEASGNLAGAAVSFQRCLSLTPDHPEATAGLQAVRRRSDLETARSTEIRRLLDSALAEYAAGDLLKARTGFQEILKLSPEDKDAQNLLAAAEKTLKLQANVLAEQAKRNAGFPQQTGDEPVTKRSVTRTRTKSAPKTSPAVVQVPSYGDLPFKRQTEIARLYQEGVAALEDGRPNDTIRYWEFVYASAPDYQQVAANLKQEYLVLGMEAFASGNLEQAIDIWEKALRIDPDDSRTKGYLARAYDHQTRIRQIKGGE